MWFKLFGICCESRTTTFAAAPRSGVCGVGLLLPAPLKQSKKNYYQQMFDCDAKNILPVYTSNE